MVRGGLGSFVGLGYLTRNPISGREPDYTRRYGAFFGSHVFSLISIENTDRTRVVIHTPVEATREQDQMIQTLLFPLI